MRGPVKIKDGFSTTRSPVGCGDNTGCCDTHNGAMLVVLLVSVLPQSVKAIVGLGTFNRGAIFGAAFGDPVLAFPVADFLVTGRFEGVVMRCWLGGFILILRR